MRTIAHYLIACLLLAGCPSSPAPAADASSTSDAGADQAPPLPATVEVAAGTTSVRLDVAAGALSIALDGESLSTAAAEADAASGPFAFGVADPFNDKLYYDPSSPPSEVSWLGAGAVTAVSTAGAVRTVSFASGASLTLEPARIDGAVKLTLKAPSDPAPAGLVMSRFCLGVVDDEVFFGFGELFDTVASRGVVRPMQLLVDTGVDSGFNEVHAPVPLAISPRGWAMLVEDFHAGAFDVAAARDDRICATFTTDELVVYLMGARDPLALVERTVALTSKPALPPIWAFAPQQWRNALDDQAQLLADAQAMRQHQIPTSVVWIDNPWQDGYNTFRFDTVQFPDAKGAIETLHAQGYKVLVWSTPYLDVKEPEYDQAAAGGWLITDAETGKPFPYNYGPSGPGTLIDLSAPGAKDFWQSLIERVTDLGVDGFKLDYGEDVGVALGAVLSPFRFHGGRSPATMHREFAALYHETYLQAVPDGFLITRAGSLGEQRVNTCIWPGDLDSNFTTHAEGRVGGLPAAISGGLSLSVSGYPFYGSDIGGFRKGLPTTELLQRWTEYAALGTVMQLGGGGKSHNPWDTTLFGAEALPHYRSYARLHTDLFPYLYSHAVVASRTGRPVTTPLGMAFADDPATWTRNFEYMLGDALLVAPVIEAGASTRELYLPAGRWVHHFSGTAYDGPKLVEVAAPVGQLPLFWKQGAIVGMLATAVDTLAPATAAGVVSYEDHKAELELRIIPGAASSFTFFDDTAVAVTSKSDAVTVEIKAGTQFSDFRLRLDWNNRSAGPATPATVSLSGTPLAATTSAASVASCAGGCWFYDAANEVLFARVLTGGVVDIR